MIDVLWVIITLYGAGLVLTMWNERIRRKEHAEWRKRCEAMERKAQLFYVANRDDLNDRR